MKKITGLDYFRLALCAFLAICLELILAGVIEPIFNVSLSSYTTLQIIIHWIIICIVWLVAGIFLISLAKKKYEFNLWQHQNKLTSWQYLVIIMCLCISIVSHYLSWEGFKPFLEFQRLGLLKFIFQYIYYFFETFLMSLIIIFGQKACEKWFNNEVIPYGGIILALTWGIIHIVSKGSILIGLISVCGGFLFGAVYLIVGKDYRKTLLLMFLMFVL